MLSAQPILPSSLALLFHEALLKFSKTPSYWKWYFQVNIWLEKSCRTLGTDQVSLAFCCPFVFAALEKKLQRSTWLTAFSLSRHGCQGFCHWYWMKACLMLWAAPPPPGPGRGLNLFFPPRSFIKKEGKNESNSLLTRDLLDFQRKVLKCLIKLWAGILLFLK